MDSKEIKTLIKMLGESDVTEFRMKQGDFELRISRMCCPQGSPQYTTTMIPAGMTMPGALMSPPAPPPAASPAAETAPAPAGRPAHVKVQTSPMVGTFYRSASPEAKPFVQVGDRVTKGQTLCIIEAMKLMNEIESEFSGRVAEILVENANPVEFGEELFLIEAE
ncbi:MAG: acetyl-CoA carboxylase biotin carboxyl carrier protein [Magnetococcus sp. WYHC-3]